eukprot:IDg13317t1
MQGNDIALRNVMQTTHLADFCESLTDALSDSHSPLTKRALVKPEFSKSVCAAQQHNNYKKRFFVALENQFDDMFKELNRYLNENNYLECRVIRKDVYGRDAISVEQFLYSLKMPR